MNKKNLIWMIVMMFMLIIPIGFSINYTTSAYNDTTTTFMVNTTQSDIGYLTLKCSNYMTDYKVNIETGSASPSYIYQEVANSTYCPNGGGVGADLWVNYTKPSGTGGAIMQYKFYAIGTVNSSLPQDCWDAYSNKIVLHYQAKSESEVCSALAQCYDGTSWQDIYTDYGANPGDGSPGLGTLDLDRFYDSDWDTSAVYQIETDFYYRFRLAEDPCADQQFYEEGIHWIDYSLNENISVDIGDDGSFEESIIRTSSETQTHTLNASKLNDYMQSQCTNLNLYEDVPIRFNMTSGSVDATINWFNVTYEDASDKWVSLEAQGGELSIDSIDYIIRGRQTLSGTNIDNPQHFIQYLQLITLPYNTTELNITLQDSDELFEQYDGLFNLTWDDTYINITLTAKQIDLEFINYSGNAVNISGYATDGTGNTQGFCNNSYVSLSSNFDGDIVRFSFDTQNECNLTQYYQFYEYENTNVPSGTKNITIVPNPTTESWFMIVDQSNRPIKDATVRLSFSIPEVDTFANYMFMGQKLTRSDGKAFFYTDPDSDIIIEVIKDGYVYSRNISYHVSSANSTSEAYPYMIYLDRDTTATERGIYVETLRTFSNRTANIPVGVLALNRDRVDYNTNYRIGQGISSSPLYLNSHNIGVFNLTPGKEFSAYTTDDIILYIYADNVLKRTIIIEYDVKNQTIMQEPSGINQDTKELVGYIVLIILAGITGLLIGLGSEEVREKAGKSATHVFLVGCILYPIVIGSGWWLAFVSILYYTLIYVRKVYGE